MEKDQKIQNMLDFLDNLNETVLPEGYIKSYTGNDKVYVPLNHTVSNIQLINKNEIDEFLCKHGLSPSDVMIMPMSIFGDRK